MTEERVVIYDEELFSVSADPPVVLLAVLMVLVEIYLIREEPELSDGPSLEFLKKAFVP